MKTAALVIGILLAISLFPVARAADDECKVIRADAAGYLTQCGSQIRSFALNSSNARWQLNTDGMHGLFSFTCVDKPDTEKLSLLERFSEQARNGSPCPDEPEVGGTFIDADTWNASAKDETAIIAIWHERLVLQAHYRGPVPSPACPAFDVSKNDLPGRATCVVEGDAGAAVGIFGDQRPFLLSFSQSGKKPEALKEKMLTVASQFTVERATGDAALLRWMK